MIISFSIPDELEATLREMYPKGDIRQIVQKVVEKWARVPLTERGILLMGESRQKVEKLLGKQVGVDEVVKAVESGIEHAKVGGSDIPLRPGQLKKISGRASHYGRELSEQVQIDVREAMDSFFGNF